MHCVEVGAVVLGAFPVRVCIDGLRNRHVNLFVSHIILPICLWSLETPLRVAGLLRK